MRLLTINHFFSRLFAILVIATLAGCGGGGDDGGSIKSPDIPSGDFFLDVNCQPGILSIGGPTGQCQAHATTVRIVETQPGVFVEDTNTVDVTNSVTWSSQDAGIVSVDSAGVTTAVSAGMTDIVATLKGETASDDVSVPEAVLQSIAVQCDPDVVIVGNSTNCVATGTFEDSQGFVSTQNITTTVTWTSSNNGIATVNDDGVATGVSAGVVDITASSGGLSGSDELTVRTLDVTSLEVTPEMALVPPLCTQQYTAIATFEDSSTADVTSSTTIVWTSTSAESTVDGAGLATAGPQGTAQATITATYTDAAGNTASDTATLDVQDTAILSLCVEAAENADASNTCNVVADFQKPAGIQVPFLAKLIYDNGNACPLATDDGRLNWSSTNEAAATVANDGVASTLAQGTTNIVATLDTLSGSHPLQVGDDFLVDYEVLPDVSCVGRYDLADGLQESPNLPGEQQMLAEGVFNAAGATCDFSDHTTCTGSLNAFTTWTASEGFWNGESCTSTIPAGTLPGGAPGQVDPDGVVTPSADGGGALRLGTVCIEGEHDNGMTEGGTVLVLPVTNDVLVDDAASLCDALSPLLLVGGEGGGAGFPLQLVSVVGQILNPALTALANDGAIPIDDILDTVVTPLSDELTSQLIGPEGPLEPLVEALDDVYQPLNCVVGGILETLLGGDVAGCSEP